MRFIQIAIPFILMAMWAVGCQYNKCYYCEVVKKKQQQQIEEPKGPSAEELMELAQAREKRLGKLRSQIKLTPLFEKWHHNIDKENIRKLYLSAELLFAETESNLLYAFDRVDGIPLWVYSVGDSVAFQPEVYGDKVYLVSMGILHILYKNTGEPIVKKELSFAPSSPLCPTNTYLYVGGWDSFLYALNMKTGNKEWRHRINGYVQARPTEKNGVVYIAGTDQRVYAINASLGYRHSISTGRHQFRKWGHDGYFSTRGGNVASVAVIDKPEYLFVGSEDYNLYCVDRLNGNLSWKFECGGEITLEPQVVPKGASYMLYVVANQSSGQESMMYMLNSEKGQIQTTIERGQRIFFIGRKYDWILRRDKKVVMLTEDGKVRNIFDLDDFDFFVSNTDLGQNRLGYMATDDGFIFALEDN